MDARRMDRKKTMTMNWDGLRDDDDEFFEPSNATRDQHSDEENEEFDDCHVALVQPVTTEFPTVAPKATPAAPDYNMWMTSPGSIKARRQKLFQGMGLNSSKQLLTFKRIISTKNPIKSVPVQAPATVKTTAQAPAEKSGTPETVKTTDQATVKSRSPASVKTTAPTTEPKKTSDEDTKKTSDEDSSKQELPHTPVSFLLVRSRSEGEIESRSAEKQRKQEMLGNDSKQRLARTYSLISTPSAKSYVLGKLKASSPRKSDSAHGHRQGGSLTSMVSKRGFEAFFLIKNLDTGKEFIVNEYDQDGMWNKLSDLQTGKKLTMEEFDKCVGYSPVVKELMRRANDNKSDSYISKSLKMSMSKGASMLKSIKGVANSMALRGEKEREVVLALEQNQKTNASAAAAAAAKAGTIWAVKFSTDARHLASAGEDSVIHVWEVQECEVMSANEAGLTPGSSPIHPSLAGSKPRMFWTCPGPNHRFDSILTILDKIRDLFKCVA